MVETIPNLWPEQFNVKVQTPLTILRVQAEYLGKVTRGILEAVVETDTNKDAVAHRLVVVAPAFNGYRHNLITVIHKRDLVYPAEVQAAALAEKVERREPRRFLEPANPYNPREPAVYDTVFPKANGDDQMQNLVHKALHSDQTTALIHSLIAKSNESSPPAATDSGVGQDDSAEK